MESWNVRAKGGFGDYLVHWLLKHNSGDFFGGPVVKSPLSNAEDKGSIPGQGTFKIAHVSGQLSPCTTTREAATTEPVHSRAHAQPCPTLYDPMDSI